MVLTKGRDGNVQYELRTGPLGPIMDPKAGRPKFDAFCKECDAKAHA